MCERSYAATKRIKAAIVTQFFSSKLAAARV